MNIKKRLSNVNVLNFRLQHQIVIYFIIFIFIPTIIVLGITYNIYFNFMNKKVQAYNSQVIKQINSTIDSKLMIYNNLTRQIYYNTDLIDSMTKISPNPYKKMLIEKSVSDTILSLVNIDKYVLSAYLLTSGMDIYYVGYGTAAPEEDYNRIRKIASDGKGRVVWIPTQKMESVFNDLAFRAVREIKAQDGTRAGTLVLIIKEAFFNDLYKDINLGYKAKNFIVTKDLTLVSSMDKKGIGEKIKLPYLKKVVNEENGNFVTKINGKENLVVFSSSIITGWTFVSTIPLKGMLNEVYSIRNLIIVIILIFTLFLIILFNILSKRITKPIKELSETIKIVQAGCFTVSIKNTNNDEIGSLSRSFNVMIAKVNELISEVKEKEKAKAKAELVALQCQINPHFMYNTLNSIRFMAVLNKQDSIKNMINALIVLLKDAAKNSDELISIDQELKLVENYIYIQNVRFGSFDITYCVPEEFKNYKIMKFTLQPVIENCILHGFSERGVYGNICLSVNIKDNKLFIEVKDNGTGMSEEILTSLFSEKNENGYSKMGIKNINDRIILNYGTNYGLIVNSTVGEGTNVTIVLPLIL